MKLTADEKKVLAHILALYDQFIAGRDEWLRTATIDTFVELFGLVPKPGGNVTQEIFARFAMLGMIDAMNRKWGDHK